MSQFTTLTHLHQVPVHPQVAPQQFAQQQIPSQQLPLQSQAPPQQQFAASQFPQQQYAPQPLAEPLSQQHVHLQQFVEQISQPQHAHPHGPSAQTLLHKLEEKNNLLETLDSELKFYKHENQVLKRQVEAQGKSVLLLSQENEELRNSLRNVPKPQVITERIESKVDIRPYQLEIEKLQNRLNELQHENETLLNENNALQNYSENLKSMQKELNVTKSRFEKEKLHHGETRSTLESLLKSRAEKINALQNQLVNVCAELEKRNKERAEMLQLQELLSRYQSQLQELELQRKELIVKVTYLQQEQEGKNHELERLQNSLQELKVKEQEVSGKSTESRRPHYSKKYYIKHPKEKEVFVQSQHEVVTTEKTIQSKDVSEAVLTEEAQVPVSRK